MRCAAGVRQQNQRTGIGFGIFLTLWYSAPPKPIYAEPGDNTYFVNPIWHIPDDAQLGSYQADFYLYSYYDSNTGRVF
jgi:hypothetical protein